MPPTELTVLEAYKDERGNEIRFTGRVEQNIRILFRGSNNTLVIGDSPHLRTLNVNFDCDNGLASIGSSGEKGVAPLSAGLRVGEDSAIRLGKSVSSTGLITLSAAEGTSIDVGDDVMFSSRNELRADDAHPIFDVTSGKRVNTSRSIVVGSHVWFAVGSCVLGGSTIGSGTVLGFNALVLGRIPNNVIAAGSPARVVRRNIAWERPHLTLTKPHYKPDASTITRSEAYWQLTEDDNAAPTMTERPLSDRVAATARRVRNRLRRD